METEFALSLGTERWALPADRDTITIGRASNADIRLQADDQISRIHARLARTGATWTLIDESRNGTALNGRRISTPTPLADDDRIHIGRSVLTFHEPTPTAGGTPPPATHNPAPSPADTPAAPPAAQSAASAHPEAFAAPLPPSIPPTAQPGLPVQEPGHLGSPPPTPETGPAASPEPPGAVPAHPHRPDAGPAHPQRVDAWPAHPERAITEPAPSGGVGEGDSADLAATDRPDIGLAEPPHATGSRSAEPAVGPTSQPQPHPQPEPQPPTDRRDSSPAPDRPASAESPLAAAGPESAYATGSPASGSEGAEGVPGAEFEWADADEAAPAVSGSGEAWAAYPSADNPEPARSPWAAAISHPRQSDRAVAGTNSPSAGWPGAGDRPAPEPAPPASDRRASADERRLPEGSSEPTAKVRLARVLTIAGAALGFGLLLNLAGTFLASGPGGALRWLVPPTIALVVAMVLALMDAVGSEQPARATRLDVRIITAMIVVLLGVGVGGFALTGGVKYAAGYITGKESGADHLIKPVAKSSDGLTVTVENVTYTSHFTRVEVTVKNDGQQSVTLPLDGNAAFTGSDGNSLKADGFRSQWTDNIAAGATKRGTVTFKGHLPEGLNAASLTLKAGGTTIAVNSIPLTN